MLPTHPQIDPADPARFPRNCAKPSVTLKCEGDVVTGIRIQCGCGRITELTCID